MNRSNTSNSTINHQLYQRMNLLIHWLEHAISDRDPILYFDLNHCSKPIVWGRNQLPNNITRTLDLQKGNIYLGHAQECRNFIELMNNNDMICEKSDYHHIDIFNASCFIPTNNISFAINQELNFVFGKNLMKRSYQKLAIYWLLLLMTTK